MRRRRDALMPALGPTVAVLAALALGIGCAGPRRPDARRPNVVLIVIDTLRADRLPIYGHPNDTAPFLTELATRAVVFERAHSTSSWTSPATASLLTSLFPFQHGVHVASLVAERGAIEVRRIPDEVDTLAEILGRAGYRTFAVVDNRNVIDAAGFARGFERFEHTDYASAPAVNATLTRWRKEVRAAAPYFLYVHYMDPHVPYHDREPWHSTFLGESVVPDPELRDALARYDSEIRFVDEHLRALFQTWGLEDDAIVLVTSDHGEEFGEHGGLQHGRTLYAEVLDVPLVLSHPSQWREGRRVGVRVSLVDVAPTILDLAGLPAHPAHVGRSLVPVIDEPAPPERPAYAHLVHPGDAPGKDERKSKGEGGYEIRAVVAGARKLLDYDDRPDQLFDLDDDASERRNAIRNRPLEAATLRADLDAFVAGAPRFEAGRADVPLTPQQAEKLRTLGYLK